MHEVRIALLAGVTGDEPALCLLQELAVGVEHAVHVADVAGAHRRVEQARVPEVPVMAGGQPLVVGDVAGGLLEVGHQASPLEHLGQHVGGLLTRQVHPAELCDRVVPVLEEDLFVEVLGPLQPYGGVDADVAADVELTDELVEEEATEALVRTRIPGKERALHHLGQVHEREHWLVEIGEVPPKDVGLFGTERFHGVGKHA